MTRRGVSDGVMRELPQSRAKGEQLLLLFAFTHCLQLPVEGPGSEEKAVSEGLIHGQFTIYAQPLSRAASSSYGINESPLALPAPQLPSQAAPLLWSHPTTNIALPALAGVATKHRAFVFTAREKWSCLHRHSSAPRRGLQRNG